MHACRRVDKNENANSTKQSNFNQVENRAVQNHCRIASKAHKIH